MVALNDNFLKPYLEENPDAPIVLAPWDYQGVVSLPGHYFHKDDVVLRDAFNDCYSEMKTNGEMARDPREVGFDPKTIPPPGPGFPPGAPEHRPSALNWQDPAATVPARGPPRHRPDSVVR